MRLTLISGLLLASLAQPALAASSPELVGLERQLTSLIAARPGEYGIAALDLRDGSTVTVNGDTPFPMASMSRSPSPPPSSPRSIMAAASSTT